MNADAAIEVSGLTKNYGDVEAVRGIDFAVQKGEVFGLLGPNGAGKTTTVEILEGIRPRSGGEVRVLGFDPEVQSKALKDRVGVCLQATNLPDKITVEEALELFASFYSRKIDGGGLLRRLQLDEQEPRLARIVECRCFGGLTIDETAEALAISPATVKRGWSLARAWLYRELQTALP